MKYTLLVFFNCIALFLSSQEVCTDLVVDPKYSINNSNLFTKGFPNDLPFFDDFSSKSIKKGQVGGVGGCGRSHSIIIVLFVPRLA